MSSRPAEAAPPVVGLEGSLLFGIRTAVFLVVLMPLIVTTSTFFPFIVGKAVFARTFIEIAFGLWLVLAFAYPRYRPRRSWLVLGFGVYLIVAILASIAGVSFQRSLWSTYERMQGVFDLAHWFVLVLVVTSVYRTAADWRMLLNFNLGVSVVMALLGVAQRYDAWSFPFYGFLESSTRIDITLGNATFVGAYMLVNVLIALGFMARSLRTDPQPAGASTRAARRRRREREARGGISPVVWWQLFWAVAIVLDLWMLILSGTRGAILGFVAGLIVFGVAYTLWGEDRRIRVAAVSLIGLLAVIIVLFAAARNTPAFEWMSERSVIVGRLSTISLDDVSVKGRRASWSAGLRGFLSKPVLGWGPENFIIASGRHFSAASGVQETFDQAHNKLIEELTTKGLLGFLTYMSLWALMLTAVVRRIRQERSGEQLFVMFLGAAMAGYFVQNLFLFDTPATVLQFVVLLGFAAHLEATSERPMLAPAWVRERFGLSPAVAEQPSTAPDGGELPRPASPIAVGAVAIVVAVLVAFSVFVLSYRPFQAARDIVAIGQHDTWSGVVGQFDKAIDAFPPLANYPRFIFITTLTQNWAVLSAQEQLDGLQKAEDMAAEAFEGEPELWRVYVALGSLYQRVSQDDASYLEQARLNVAKAVELAPEAPLVVSLANHQETVEAAVGSARDSARSE